MRPAAAISALGQRRSIGAVTFQVSGQNHRRRGTPVFIVEVLVRPLFRARGYTASLIAQGGVRIFWTNWRNGALYKSEGVPAISGRRAAKSSPEKSPSRVR